MQAFATGHSRSKNPMPAKVAYKSNADDSDPLALHPPPFESTEERNARLMTEQQAKAISDKIDADLEKTVLSEKRGPKPIKILLLGTSFAEISLACRCSAETLGQGESG